MRCLGCNDIDVQISKLIYWKEWLSLRYQWEILLPSSASNYYEYIFAKPLLCFRLVAVHMLQWRFTFVLPCLVLENRSEERTPSLFPVQVTANTHATPLAPLKQIRAKALVLCPLGVKQIQQMKQAHPHEKQFQGVLRLLLFVALAWKGMVRVMLLRISSVPTPLNGKDTLLSNQDYPFDYDNTNPTII